MAERTIKITSKNSEPLQTFYDRLTSAFVTSMGQEIPVQWTKRPKSDQVKFTRPGLAGLIKGRV